VPVKMNPVMELVWEVPLELQVPEINVSRQQSVAMANLERVNKQLTRLVASVKRGRSD
jgi:hypothetical protein